MPQSPNVIECARVNLRLLGVHDAPFMLELLNEAGFLRFIGDKGVRTKIGLHAEGTVTLADDGPELLLFGPSPG